MNIKVKVRLIPKTKQNCITDIEWKDGILKVRAKVTAPAQDGKANQALLKLIAEYFMLPKTQLKIISGEKAREKLLMLYNIPADRFPAIPTTLTII